VLHDLVKDLVPSSPSSLHKVSSGNPYPIIDYITCANFSKAHRSYLATLIKIIDPRHFHEAFKDSRWREAMENKIEALECN